MSLLQDYEMARRKIGTKKYDAINVYLEEICPTKIRNKYKQELKKINDLGINEWEREKKKLEQKYRIVYLDDVLYNEEGWKKFEQWYEKYSKMKNEKEQIEKKEVDGFKDKINDFLQNNEKYKEFELQYILIDDENLNDSIAIAFKADEIIQINPYNMKIEDINEWAYNFDEDFFKKLEEDKVINYVSIKAHFNIWMFIENNYPNEVEYKKGTQIYLKYCKQHKITRKTIDKGNGYDDTPNVMRYYKENKDRQR